MLPVPYRLNWSFCLLVFLRLFMLQYSYCSTASIFSQHPPNASVPALFAFGDSLVDTGNNNDLLTLGRCNFPPYGVNFHDGLATGRFSNGRLTIDFYAEALGIKKYVQAYLDPSLQVQDLLTGVSFASSGSGFDSMTSHLASVRSLNEQLKMFKRYRRRIKSVVGYRRAEFILRNSIFIVAAGSWDLANTYFALPFRRVQYDVDSYTTFMLKRASLFLKKLYRLGARNIGVSNVPPLGNIPTARTLAGGLTRESAEHYNQAVEMFNIKLNVEVQYLNNTLPQAKLVYIDLYGIMTDILHNKTRYGFEVIDRGCCGSGLIEAGPLCNPFSRICDSEKFVFWDSYHPTEAVNQIFAAQTFEKYFHLFF
ncbi:hypothetical protein vseg_017866 [Gypsophila vaccaria]